MSFASTIRYSSPANISSWDPTSPCFSRSRLSSVEGITQRSVSGRKITCSNGGAGSDSKKYRSKWQISGTLAVLMQESVSSP